MFKLKTQSRLLPHAVDFVANINSRSLNRMARWKRQGFNKQNDKCKTIRETLKCQWKHLQEPDDHSYSLTDCSDCWSGEIGLNYQCHDNYVLFVLRQILLGL